MCHEGACEMAGCSLEAGEPCEGSFCSDGACDEATGLCVPWPTLGEACEVLCQPPYACSSLGNGTCVLLEENGEGCRGSEDCASGFCARDYAPYCDHQTCNVPSCDDVCGTCVDPPTAAACE